MQHFSDNKRLQDSLKNPSLRVLALRSRIGEFLESGPEGEFHRSTIVVAPPHEATREPFPRLIVVLEGRITFGTGAEERFHMGPGDMLMLGSRAWVLSDFRQQGSILSTVLRPDLARVIWFWRNGDGLVHPLPTLTLYHHTTTPPAALYTLMEWILASGASGATLAQACRTLLAICHEMLDVDLDSEAGGHPVYLKAMEILLDSPHRPITREEVANQVGVHPDHLGRLFNKFGGEGFAKTQNSLRLNHAARLLTQPGATVKNVAAECGFSNPVYFIRCFRNHFGKTPGSFHRAAVKTPAGSRQQLA